jgi:flagellar hook assembly protein FlgD
MESRTTFHFGGVLPVAAELTIYDVRGRSLRQLAIDAGRSEATWDGRDRRGVQVASGNYIASMAVQGRRFTTRLVKLN